VLVCTGYGGGVALHIACVAPTHAFTTVSQRDRALSMSELVRVLAKT
jgi:hypothetical protein